MKQLDLICCGSFSFTFADDNSSNNSNSSSSRRQQQQQHMTLHKVQCQDLAPHMYILPHAEPRNAMRQFPSAIILKNMPHFGACQRSVHSHSINRSFIHSFYHSSTRSLTHSSTHCCIDWRFVCGTFKLQTQLVKLLAWTPRSICRRFFLPRCQPLGQPATCPVGHLAKLLPSCQLG